MVWFLEVYDKIFVKCFDHKSIDKYTRIGVGRDGIDMKSMINLVLMKVMKHMIDVKSIMVLGMGISNPYTVLFKINLMRGMR